MGEDVGVDVGDTVCPTAAGTDDAVAVVTASTFGADVSNGKQTASI